MALHATEYQNVVVMDDAALNANQGKQMLTINGVFCEKYNFFFLSKETKFLNEMI